MATATKKNREMTEGAIREIVDEMLRDAFRTQARELEKHLTNIHERLKRAEGIGDRWQKASKTGRRCARPSTQRRCP